MYVETLSQVLYEQSMSCAAEMLVKYDVKYFMYISDVLL